MTKVVVITPFRDRGLDPLRAANLQRVRELWADHMPGIDMSVVSDGRDGDAQFNRSAAYNRGVALNPAADVFIFAEADMLIGRLQIDRAIEIALHRPGMVVPFSHYRYLTDEASVSVRAGKDPRAFAPEFVIGNNRSIGAINVVSRLTMEAVGQFDETFEGNWYDDDAMKIAFEVLTGPTRFVHGPAYHLHHLPGWKGDHLTDADRAATERNQRRLELYQALAKREDAAEAMKHLVKGLW